MRPLKLLVGIALMPLAVAAIVATARLLFSLRPGELGAHPLSLHAFGLGAVMWFVFWLLFPRPFRVYVLGHELTHALWAVAFGGRATHLKVSARGGSVRLSKTNWAITLAPYFFPLYTLLVIAAAALVGVWVNLKPYEPLVVGAVGLTYAFHLTFTAEMLAIRQPDIREQGRIFSWTIILLFNALVLALGIVAAGSPTLRDYVVLVQQELLRIMEWLRALSAMGLKTLADFHPWGEGGEAGGSRSA